MGESEAARELGRDEDEAAFDEKLKRVAQQRPRERPADFQIPKSRAAGERMVRAESASTGARVRINRLSLVVRLRAREANFPLSVFPRTRAGAP